MSAILTEEQRAEVARIQDIVMAKVRVEVAAMAERSEGTCWMRLWKSVKKGVLWSARDLSALWRRGRLRGVQAAAACADAGGRDRV
jgi:hypothetical protein